VLSFQVILQSIGGAAAKFRIIVIAGLQIIVIAGLRRHPEWSDDRNTDQVGATKMKLFPVG